MAELYQLREEALSLDLGNAGLGRLSSAIATVRSSMLFGPFHRRVWRRSTAQDRGRTISHFADREPGNRTREQPRW